MIRFKLAEIMGKRKMTNISEVARLSGLNRLTVKGLYDEEAQGIKWSTLEGLCKALDCEPNDLIIRE